LSDEDKLELYHRQVAMLASETHDADATLNRLGARFRELKLTTEPLADARKWAAHALAAPLLAVREGLGPLGEVAAELVCLDDHGRLTTTRTQLVASILHMHLNRLFRRAPRMQEMVVYDHLRRFALSRLKRNRPA
jgi:thiopeptide-type bacteriocin biosynthesis protein